MSDDEVRVTREVDYGATAFFWRSLSQRQPKRLPPSDRLVPAKVWSDYEAAVKRLQAAEREMEAFW